MRTTKKEFNEMKKVIIDVMNNEIGFAPAKDKIVMLESGFNGYKYDYLRFRIANNDNIEYVIITTKGMTESGYELRIEDSNSYDSIQLNR